MTILKSFLTKETISLFDFEISTFFITAIIILAILIIFIKIKRVSIRKNILNLGLLTLSIITFLFAFLNGFTGEYLFSQKDNIRIYMFIATVSLGIYIFDTLKNIVKTRH